MDMNNQQTLTNQDMETSGTLREIRNPDAFKFDSSYQRFAEFMGVDRYKRGDRELAKKLDSIYEWGRIKSNTDDPDEIFRTIDAFRKESGVTFIGEELAKFLYRRTRLDNTVQTEPKAELQTARDEMGGAVHEVINSRLDSLKKQVSKQVNREIVKSVEQSIKRSLYKA